MWSWHVFTLNQPWNVGKGQRRLYAHGARENVIILNARFSFNLLAEEVGHAVTSCSKSRVKLNSKLRGVCAYARISRLFGEREYTSPTSSSTEGLSGSPLSVKSLSSLVAIGWNLMMF